MLHLTSRGLLRRARNTLEQGPARSGAIMVTSAAVGMTAGKLGKKSVPLIAVGAGAALNLAGLHTIGDGALAGGLTLLGYRAGARMEAKQTVAAAPPPASLPPQGKRKA